MQLTQIRRASAHGATISQLLVDAKPECFICEDVVRAAGEPKVFGKTAIPAGTYQVVVTFSNRFQRLLPLLIDLPGHTTLFGGRPIGECGIRIHPGNTAADTEGCLLPGQRVGADEASIAGGTSKPAFNALFAKIQAAAARHEAIKITIK